MEVSKSSLAENKSSPPRAADLKNDPSLIRVFDKYGHEMYVTKEQWRENVLPGALKSSWNDPDRLYGLIVQSLNDGFRSDVIKAAEQLHEVDTQHVRGACTWGIVLMEEGRLDEAEDVFKAFIARHGEDGVILTNLAKIYARRRDDARAEKTLWHALEIDPNQDNGLAWFCGIQRDRGGDEAAEVALRRIATVPGSWRAQLWLARNALLAHRPDEALTMYRDCLERSSKPIPPDLLLQMSGDLGRSGHVSAILQLCGPYFSPKIHGLQVGNNLIKANIDLGHPEAASQILNELYAMKRPDWQQTLSFWDTEIAKARLTKVLPQTPMAATMLFGEGPVWLSPQSPGVELFPEKASGGISICFLGSSAESDNRSQQIQHQLANTSSRLSRAIPLFLAEHVNFSSDARVQTLVPWMTQNGNVGFILSGVAWSDEDAIRYGTQGHAVSDYVVTTHLKCQSEPWTLELRLLRVSDGKCLENWSAAFTAAKPEAGIMQLGRNLLTSLVDQLGIKITPIVSTYQVPAGANFPYYLLRLEQLLAVRCSGMDNVPTGFLNGEREIIDGNIQLCLACPGSVNTRLLLAKTMLSMKKVRPDILAEFKDKLAALQSEQQLPQPAHGVIEKIVGEALAD